MSLHGGRAPRGHEGVSDAGTFDVSEDKAGKYRFRLKAGNGEVVASGEAYETKAAAKKGCEAVQRAALGAGIVETASERLASGHRDCGVGKAQ